MKRFSLSLYSWSVYSTEQEKRKMQFHSHNSLEISYVHSGILEFVYKVTPLKEEKISIFRDQILIVFPNLVHKTDIPLNLSCLGIEFTPNNGDFMDSINDEQLKPFLDEKEKALQRGYAIIDSNPELVNLLKSFEKFKTKNDLNPYELTKLDLQIKYLFFEVLHNIQNDIWKSKYNYYVIKAISYINENYYKNIKIDDVVESVNCSRSYLENVFKKELSCGIKEKINSVRINKSIEFLKNTGNSISSIGETVGFESTQIFIRNFKKITGKTPKVFRKDESTIESSRFFKDNGFYKEIKF